MSCTYVGSPSPCSPTRLDDFVEVHFLEVDADSKVSDSVWTARVPTSFFRPSAGGRASGLAAVIPPAACARSGRRMSPPGVVPPQVPNFW